MKCPKCGSEKTQYVSNTINEGPSFSKGCCGWLVLGPIGILCSFCGDRTEKEEYWICHDCGTKFQAGDYESELEYKTSRVEGLKQEITKMENFLEENMSDDFEDKLKEATAQYNTAKEKHDQFEKDFIGTSGVLKILNVLFLLLPTIAIIITAFFTFGMLFWVGSILGAIFFAVIGIVITLALTLIIGAIENMAQKRIDPEKAEKLGILQEDYKNKENQYKELKKIRDTKTSLWDKKSELKNAEKDLDTYKKS